MSQPTKLPFGQTDITLADIRDLIDEEQAIEMAQHGDVNRPVDQIDQFIQAVPNLLVWLNENGRIYPWRQTTDPWTIYATEILLQRTRADAVNSIYETFFDRFSTPEDVYEAPDKRIEDTVRSLGFVNHRTRSLKEVASLIVEQHNGEVPNSVDELRKPWRVGEYSARAVQLFARGDPLALVDSNFARVMGRVLGYEMPNQPHKSDEVYRLMGGLTPSNSDVARAFNLAILDLGALICTPTDPLCGSCPVSAACHYYQSGERDADHQ